MKQKFADTTHISVLELSDYVLYTLIASFMGLTWDPCHVGPLNLVIWVVINVVRPRTVCLLVVIATLNNALSITISHTYLFSMGHLLIFHYSCKIHKKYNWVHLTGMNFTLYFFCLIWIWYAPYTALWHAIQHKINTTKLLFCNCAPQQWYIAFHLFTYDEPVADLIYQHM